MGYENATELERKLYHQAAQAKRPFSGSIELLPLCNMNCDMCYVRLSRAEMEKKGRLRTREEWLDLAVQMQRAGVLFLLLTGGEVLLYPGFKELYLELRRMGFVLTINTNGTLIDERWAAFFGMYPPRRINSTLYGCDEETYEKLCHYPGGFEKTKQGVRLLREQNVDVKINASLVKSNRADAPRIARIAKELDAALHADTYMYPATREREWEYNDDVRLSPEEAAILRVQMMKREIEPLNYMATIGSRLIQLQQTPVAEEKPGRMRCQAGRSAFTVNWQGQMRPCVMLSEPSINVFDVGFDEAWKKVAEGVDGIKLASRCSACRFREVCSVCAAKALHETGKYDGVPKYVCRYTQAMMYAFSLDVKAFQEAEKKREK